MNFRNGPLALLFHALFIAFILAPIVMVCAVAFTSEGFISLPTGGLSLRWFKAILDNPRFIDAFWFSLGLGALSATIAVSLAVPGALALARSDAHTSELQSLMRISYAVFCLKTKTNHLYTSTSRHSTT